MAKRRTPATALLSETAIQAACVDILRFDGWRPLKTDPVSDKGRGKGFGEKGMADHQFVRYSSRRLRYRDKGRAMSEFLPRDCWVQLIWIEFKKLDRRGNPTKAEPHQQDWHRDERIRGGVTFIAGEDFPATIEGFEQWYRTESGLYRQVLEPPDYMAIPPQCWRPTGGQL